MFLIYPLASYTDVSLSFPVGISMEYVQCSVELHRTNLSTVSGTFGEDSNSLPVRAAILNEDRINMLDLKETLGGQFTFKINQGLEAQVLEVVLRVWTS